MKRRQMWTADTSIVMMWLSLAIIVCVAIAWAWFSYSTSAMRKECESIRGARYVEIDGAMRCVKEIKME